MARYLVADQGEFPNVFEASSHEDAMRAYQEIGGKEHVVEWEIVEEVSADTVTVTLLNDETADWIEQHRGYPPPEMLNSGTIYRVFPAGEMEKDARAGDKPDELGDFAD